MAEVKQYDFYYGAILNIILLKNPDASPTLLEATEKRGVYKITTNTSKDSIVFCKYTAYFNMHVEKRRDTEIHLKTNRIELRIEDIIDQVVDFSPEYYEKYCKEDEQIKIYIDSKAGEKLKENKSHKSIISGQAVRTLSINHGVEGICPIHNSNMKVVYVHIARQPDTVHYCERCGKFMVSPKHCQDLKRMLKKRKRFIEFERMEK